MAIRRPAVAGTWYPDAPERLAAAVDAHLAAAGAGGLPPDAHLLGLVVPHAGLMYSGPVAAHAYSSMRGRRWEAAVLIGPSHYLGFNGAAVWRRGTFETPLGPLRVSEEHADALLDCCPILHERPAAHRREHSLEMQLPFLAALAPALPIVPIVMGQQTRETATLVADALTQAFGDRTLLIASSDLSHFFDTATAARLDAEVVADIEALDADGLMNRVLRRPEHACGGGPIVSVLRAARAAGATASRVLRYADSGDVSGDKQSVVGYVAAAIWR